MIVELGGDFDSILTDRPIEIKGLNYHLRIEEIEPGVLVVSGLTDHSLSTLVVRPKSRNQVFLEEDAGRGVKPIARPHRVLDAHALDVWMERIHPPLYEHWQDREAEKMDLWEYIGDHHPDVWREFEQYVHKCLLEGGRVR